MKRTLLVIVALGMSLVLGGHADAARPASLTLHARQCPLGAPVTDIFVECHPFPAPRGDSFAVDGGSAVHINAAGNVAFAGLASGNHLVTQIDGQFSNEFLHERVYCSRNGGTAKELSVVAGEFIVATHSGDAVICDVYFIPESGRG